MILLKAQLLHYATSAALGCLSSAEETYELALGLSPDSGAQGLARRTPWRVPQGTGGSTTAPFSSCSTLWKRGMMRPVSPSLSVCLRYSTQAELSLETAQLSAGSHISSLVGNKPVHTGVTIGQQLLQGLHNSLNSLIIQQQERSVCKRAHAL